MKLPASLLGSLALAAAGLGLTGCNEEGGSRSTNPPAVQSGGDKAPTPPAVCPPENVGQAPANIRDGRDSCPACGRG